MQRAWDEYAVQPLAQVGDDRLGAQCGGNGDRRHAVSRTKHTAARACSASGECCLAARGAVTDDRLAKSIHLDWVSAEELGGTGDGMEVLLLATSPLPVAANKLPAAVEARKAKARAKRSAAALVRHKAGRGTVAAPERDRA